LAIAGVATPTFADLLGNVLGFPRIVFARGSTNVIDGAITINSTPIIFQETAGTAPIFVNPATGGYESLDITAPVDVACSGTGPGSLLLVGKVDLGDGDVQDGDLLIGTVTEFGS
jgi:hypothetical protein